MAQDFVRPSLEDMRRSESRVLRVRFLTVFMGAAVVYSLPLSHPFWVRPAAILLVLFTSVVAGYLNERAKTTQQLRLLSRSLLAADFLALTMLIIAYEPIWPAAWVGWVIYTAIAAMRERYEGAIAAGIAGMVAILLAPILQGSAFSTQTFIALFFQIAVLWLNVLNVGLLVREIDERNQALMKRSEELAKAAEVEQSMLSETKSQAATMRKIVELTVTLMRERELATLLDRILETTIRAFGFRAGSILVADRDREIYRYSAVRGYPPDVELFMRQREIAFAQVELKLDKRFAIRPTVFYAPVEKQSWYTDPLVVYDRSRLDESRATPEDWHEADTLIFELHSSSGDVIGLLIPDAPADGKVPSSSLIDNVVLFAHLAAAAIENVHLFTTEQRRAEELSETNREVQRLYREAEMAAESRRKQAARLSSILDLTASIFKEHDLDRMLNRILEVALSQFNFQAGTIVLRDPRRNVFVRRAAVGYPENVVGEEISDADMQASMTERTKVRDTYYYIPMELHIGGGVVRNPQLSKLPRGGPGEWHEDDLMLFPFFDSHSRFIGVLSPDEPRDRLIPDEETVRTIEVFAQLASVAVESARLQEAAGSAPLRS